MTRRQEKQLEQLTVLEEEFRTQLEQALRVCAAGQDSLLFNATDLMPKSWPPHVRSAITDTLWVDAGEILARRRQHGLEWADSLAHRFQEECRANLDLDDHNRLGTRRRAAEFLADLEDGSTSSRP